MLKLFRLSLKWIVIVIFAGLLYTNAAESTGSFVSEELPGLVPSQNSIQEENVWIEKTTRPAVEEMNDAAVESLTADNKNELSNHPQESESKHPAQHLAVPDESLAVDADGDLNLKPSPSPIKPDITELSSNDTINVVEDSTNATCYRCTCLTGKENGGKAVELVNSTRLLSILITESNVTNRKTAADCVVILFYARYCPYSSMAAPHFNALPRVFPDIKMAAVDAMKFHSFNTQYGIVGVPTVMLFHNGRPAAKFNYTEYTLEMFAKFITKNTGMEPSGKLFVMSSDFGGPVSSIPTKEFDYCLALSLIFIAMCALYFFSQSIWWRLIVEIVLNTWRESEAQHEHTE